MDENLSAQNSPYVLLDSQITVACLQCTFIYIVLIYLSFHLGFDTGFHFCLMQIRRSLLNEDEYGFRKARRPIYYDEGLEVTTCVTGHFSHFSRCNYHSLFRKKNI